MSVQQALQFRWNRYVETIQMEDEWIVLHADNYTMTRLNEVGGWVWSLLQEPRSIDELVQMMEQAYDVAKDQARADVETFLSQILEVGLVESVNE